MTIAKSETLLLIFVLTFSMLVHGQEDSLKISRDDWESLVRRIERLEHEQANPHKWGYRHAASPDAMTGATVRTDTASVSGRRTGGRLTLGGYGEVAAKYCFYSNNYLRYGKTPEKYSRDRYGEVDLPHVVFFIGYDFGRGWSVGSEIEFEHGGIESAVEIEEEEGGEYESEIERGGEVALEQFWLQKNFNRYAVLRAGMQVLPVGGLNAHHEPTEFFGVYRPEGEFTIIPSTWHEVALTLMGQTKSGLHYQFMLVPGLDSDRFNRKNWVNPGAGSPYEFKLANVWAGVARAEYKGLQGLRLGLSAYCGNSFRNTLSRSSGEIDSNEALRKINGMVTIGSFDFCYNDHHFILRGGLIYGHLGDAAAITEYNIGMRKGSVSSKQWVASDAIAAGVEVGFDFFAFNSVLHGRRQCFYVFARYDYYDSMFRYDNRPTNAYAWCGRHRIAAGINYFPLKELAVKAEFAYGILNPGVRADGTVGKIFNDEPLVALGIAYAGMFKF